MIASTNNRDYNMKFTYDGFDYTLNTTGTSNGTHLEIVDSEGVTIGTVEIDDNMEYISYDKDGETGSLSYWDFCDHDACEHTDDSHLELAKWVVGTSY